MAPHRPVSTLTVTTETKDEAVTDSPRPDEHPLEEQQPAVDTPTEGEVAQAAQVAPVAAEPAADAPVEPAPEALAPTPEAPAVPVPAAPAGTPSPAAMPSPAMFAARPRPPAAPVVPVHAPSDSARFGRVAEDGTVYVREGEGERAVGSYPGASADEALQYFARKYDELYAAADLLRQRVDLAEVTSRDLSEGLKGLRQHIGSADVVGDLDALNALVAQTEAGIASKRESESATRAAAKAEALAAREELVTQAEQIAAQPVERVQWKSASATMRSLLDSWKEQQKSGARLDKDEEAALWQRFSRARNSFDKGRRTHFAELEGTRAEGKSQKVQLVADAERLATSTDWAATAGAFKRLMDQWRQAGRASRQDDDALWERFKSAQDRFFAAKDEVAAAEDEEFRANLDVKLALLTEAEALLPITDLPAAKAALRGIQDRWEAAGKVPRADIERTEKAMRRVESAVRDAEDNRWRRSNPEVASRAQSLADQLETSVAKLEAELESARAAGNERKVKDLADKLTAQRAWLDQARGGLREFGG